jgi:hypothetical protein
LDDKMETRKYEFQGNLIHEGTLDAYTIWPVTAKHKVANGEVNGVVEQFQMAKLCIPKTGMQKDNCLEFPDSGCSYAYSTVEMGQLWRQQRHLQGILWRIWSAFKGKPNKWTSSRRKLLMSELIIFATASIHSGAALGRLFSCWVRISQILSNLKTTEGQSQFTVHNGPHPDTSGNITFLFSA